MPIPMAAQPGPTMRPIAVGMVTKNAPLATPLTAAKTTKGLVVSDSGHMASTLTALKAMVNNIMFVGPKWSPAKPAPKRPIAVQALKPATMRAPVEAERPIDWAKGGKKNGGTKSANVPTAPARNNSRKACCCTVINRRKERF